MLEQYAKDVFPLIDELMKEIQNGTASSSLSASLRRRLESFEATVTTRTGSSPAVMIRWVSLTKVAA
jgi:hypothetical protein